MAMLYWAIGELARYVECKNIIVKFVSKKKHVLDIFFVTFN